MIHGTKNQHPKLKRISLCQFLDVGFIGVVLLCVVSPLQCVVCLLFRMVGWNLEISCWKLTVEVLLVLLKNSK